jgi:RNA polymerase sigma-70 factor (ECF subfamily)
MLACRPLDPSQREWLAQQYEQHFQAVNRLCRRMLKDPDDAADAANEAFIRAAESFPSDRSPDAARSWILTVARNYCLDLLRRRKRMNEIVPLIAADLEQSTDPEEEVVGRQHAAALLAQLPERERIALWHSAIEHQPVAEIASSLKLNYMAAAQVLSRARRHALAAAAKVALVFLGLAKLFRSSRGAGLPATAAKAAALLLLPAAVMTAQTASTPEVGPGARIAGPQSARHFGAASLSGQTLLTSNSKKAGINGAPSAQSRSSTLVNVLPAASAVTSTVGSVTGNVGQKVNQVKSALPRLPTPSPSPTPTIPSPKLPIPPSTPGLPLSLALR